VAHPAGAALHVFTVVAPRIPMWPRAALDPEWPGYEEAAPNAARASWRALVREAVYPLLVLPRGVEAPAADDAVADP
jgi:hypothetical protein